MILGAIYWVYMGPLDLLNMNIGLLWPIFARKEVPVKFFGMQVGPHYFFRGIIELGVREKLTPILILLDQMKGAKNLLGRFFILFSFPWETKQHPLAFLATGWNLLTKGRFNISMDLDVSLQSNKNRLGICNNKLKTTNKTGLAWHTTVLNW